MVFLETEWVFVLVALDSLSMTEQKRYMACAARNELIRQWSEPLVILPTPLVQWEVGLMAMGSEFS